MLGTGIEMNRGSAGTSFGVDGCRGGWFYIGLEPSKCPRSGIASELAQLVRAAGDSDRIFVDIPIGLQAQTRQCDRMARKLLGHPRASSVFPPPARQALESSGYAEASKCNHAVTGRRLSRQTFAIVPKIREVDTLLRRSDRARRIVREVHPEVCFHGFAGRSMKSSKKKPEGYRERLALLESVRPGAACEVRDILEQYRRKDVARDDVVDAMAAAITAASAPSALRTLPAFPERDREGLAMEMVYVDGSRLGRP